MFVTMLRSQFEAPAPQGMHVFLGCPAPGGLPAGKVLALPQLDEDAVQRVLELDPLLFRDGATVIVDDGADSSSGGPLESIQKHIALLYCKFFFMPMIRDTITDIYGVRQKSQQPPLPFMPNRILTLLRNIPLYLTSPLTESVERRKIACPVYIVLGGSSVRGSGEALRQAAKHCVVICVARTLNFCLEQGVEPDFVITLDTDWRYGQVLEGSKLRHTWLVSLSMCNVWKIASRFAGVFFMESFHTGILRKTYRMRESWLSVAICTLGLAEVLHSPKIILSGADGCWSGETGGYVGYFSEDTAQCDRGEASAEIVLPVSGEPRALPKKNFTVRTVGGREAQSTLVYYATTAELDNIAREFRQRDVQLWQLGDRGILNPTLYPVLAPDKLSELENWPILDRNSLQEQLRLAHQSPLPLAVESLETFLLSQKQLAEQCHVTLLLQMQQGEDVSKHPLIYSMLTTAQQFIFPNFPSAASRARGGVALCEYWLRLQRRAMTYLALYRCRRNGAPVRLAYRQEDVKPLLKALQERFPGLKIVPVEVPLWMLDPITKEQAESCELFSGVLCDENPVLIAPALWRLGQDVWPCMGEDQCLELDDILNSCPA